MYSAARVNQLKMKDTCFEFVISVSRQGNNVKIKYNLKINLQILQSSNMKCFQKIVHDQIQSTMFAKSFILDVSLGSEYVSNYRFWIRLFSDDDEDDDELFLWYG